MKRVIELASLLLLTGLLLTGLLPNAPVLAQAPVRLPDLPPVVSANRLPPVPLAVQVERALGQWELSTPGGEKQCRIIQQNAKAKVGMLAGFDPACAKDFPVTADVSGWAVTPEGHVLWLNAQGVTLLDFSETDTGIFEALRAGDPTVYFLTNLALAASNVATPADLVGGWVMSRPQTRLTCPLTLDEGVLGGGSSPMEERLVVKPSEACDKAFGALRLFAWRLERELLVLYGNDQQVLTFRRDADNRWNKVPAERTPLVLTRP